MLAVLLWVATAASANEAAPNSAVAKERLERIQRKMDAPDLKSPDSQRSLATYLDYLNKLYARADYDFPKSLVEYYQDAAERNGGQDQRTEAQFIANIVVTIHSLMAGMPAENAFPGKEYEAVRVAYKSMRSVERGIKLSDEEIARAKNRKAEAEAKIADKWQREKNIRSLQSLGFWAAIAVIVSCLVGLLLWPFWMFLQRRKLAEKEQAAPYIYIKKYAKYPATAAKDKLNPGK